MQCQHYQRMCHVKAPCCNRWVPCRLCHDELYSSDHLIDRHLIGEMKCLNCGTEQKCAKQCGICDRIMADYFCNICNLFDHDGVKKKIFHCDQCGICRVGGQENYFHCETCDGCYPLKLQDNHKCLAGSMHKECPICLELMFSSLESVNILPCGHLIHGSCMDDYIRYGNLCPSCRAPLHS